MKSINARMAPVLAAVLVLAACGSSDDTSSPVDSPSDPTVDSVGPSGDGLRAPTPVEVVSGGSATDAATESAPAAGGQIASSDMMIAPWVVEYVIGEGLGPLPTDDTGYVLEATAEVTAEQVASIAAALGVAGEPVRLDEGFGVSWRVGPDDGSGPSVWVYEDGQQHWNYNAAWDRVETAAPCAVSVDAEGNETSDCPEPEAPVGVPTADEAERRATELLTALGVDPADVRLETFADQWSANVTASDPTDERAALRNWYFGFGAEGVLQFAGGTLATPAPVGPYPLIGLDEAVARLSDGFYGGFGGGFGGGGIAIAEPDIAVASEPVAEEDPAAPEPVDEGDVEDLREPMPVEPVPDGEPVVVTLVDVEADLWWAWDAEGVAWLLPAYRFIDENGGWHVAPAVTDEFLIQADPVAVDGPIPVEPGDGSVDSGEAVPPPEPLPPESLPVEEAPDAVDIEPGTDPEVALPTLEQFVGLSIEEFSAEAQAIGFTTRISMLDGEPLAGTADYRTDRVNVVVESERVVAIDSIG